MPKKGYKQSEEQKRNYSLLYSGKNSPMYGKHPTPETLKKKSISATKYFKTHKHPNKGKVLSNITKKKVSLGLKNYFNINQDAKKVQGQKLKKYYETHNAFWTNKNRSLSTNKKISKTLMGKYCGEKNPCWKGGRQLRYGYIYIYSPNHPNASDNYRPEHQLVVEKFIGRILEKDELVHHIDFDKSNNNITNLYLTNRSRHGKLHNSIGPLIKKLILNNIICFNKQLGAYEYETKED